MGPKINRRTFVSAATAVAGLQIVSPRTAFSYRVNEQLNIAVVGMRGYAAWHGMAETLHDYDNVAYAISCDVDERKYRQVYELWDQRAREWPASDNRNRRRAADTYVRLAQNHPPLYADFRKMLDDEHSRIDGVLCATPDHSHTVIAATALRAGKPVFVEKPMSISGHEARALRMMARQYKLPTAVNTHGASQPSFRRGVELLREGRIGPVEEVHMWFRRGGRNFEQTPREVEDIPPELNWDQWLAQLPYRQYNRRWINRVGWRDVCIGELGNMGPHVGNLAFMGLDIADLWDGTPGDHTIRVSAEVSEINRLSFPAWETIQWEVPARGDRPPLRLTWHHSPQGQDPGGCRPMVEAKMREAGASEQEVQDVQWGRSCLVVGRDGLLLANANNSVARLVPQSKFSQVNQNRPEMLPNLLPDLWSTYGGSYPEWFAAVRGIHPMPLTNFEYHGAYHEFLNLGSVATMFPEETLEFDPVTGRITNHDEANAAMRYEYREGYRLL